MKKKKRKLKIKSIILLVTILTMIIGLTILINHIKYINSYEYKLMMLGYKDENLNYLLTLENEKKDYILTLEYNESLISILSQKYFLWKNIDKYIEFEKEYKKINENEKIEEKFENIIAMVNVSANKEWYTEPVLTDISKDKTILVNKFHYLPEDYDKQIENKIVKIKNWYAYGDRKIIDEVYEKYIKMYNDAKKLGLDLIINSAYRTKENQTKIYEDYKEDSGTTYADSYAARPGFSEHQTGLALDIFTPDYARMSTFHLSEEYKWLASNSYKYGFIMRYPEGKEHITGYAYESWHFRYLGIDLATKVYESGLTYDEYYAYYLEG